MTYKNNSSLFCDVNINEMDLESNKEEDYPSQTNKINISNMFDEVLIDGSMVDIESETTSESQISFEFYDFQTLEKHEFSNCRIHSSTLNDSKSLNNNECNKDDNILNISQCEVEKLRRFSDCNTNNYNLSTIEKCILSDNSLEQNQTLPVTDISDSGKRDHSSSQKINMPLVDYSNTDSDISTINSEIHKNFERQNNASFESIQTLAVRMGVSCNYFNNDSDTDDEIKLKSKNTTNNLEESDNISNINSDIPCAESKKQVEFQQKISQNVDNIEIEGECDRIEYYHPNEYEESSAHSETDSENDYDLLPSGTQNVSLPTNLKTSKNSESKSMNKENIKLNRKGKLQILHKIDAALGNHCNTALSNKIVSRSSSKSLKNNLRRRFRSDFKAKKNEENNSKQIIVQNFERTIPESSEEDSGDEYLPENDIENDSSEDDFENGDYSEVEDDELYSWEVGASTPDTSGSQDHSYEHKYNLAPSQIIPAHELIVPESSVGGEWYYKSNCCCYCFELCSRVDRHLITKHKNTKTVQKIISIVGNSKQAKAKRRHYFDILRKAGNDRWNIDKSINPNKIMIPSRRKATNKGISKSSKNTNDSVQINSSDNILNNLHNNTEKTTTNKSTKLEKLRCGICFAWLSRNYIAQHGIEKHD
ncbi:homeobox protein 2-like [Phymastichus coffea]|uniref:homeobox protein 2-like n=1 Tax=Phymastichus coffea TaxID=108790 RepID=UPI00273BF20D|nr:homeobox protein 2-like [Phymastichus coffea]